MQPHHLSLAAMGLWLLLACLMPRLLPFLPLRLRGAAPWVVALLGVPVLGWLTLHWGPGMGVAGFAVGLLVLYRPPLRRRTGARAVARGRQTGR